MENAITIKKVSKQYGKLQATKNISLSIKKGEFFAFLGPNGAGKTTLINCITGLSTFQNGSISVFKHDVVQDYKEARKQIGLSPQEFHFDPYFSIKEILIYQAGFFGLPKNVAKKRADELLKQFDLYEKRDVDFRQLSGGMKRRLSLAKAMIHDPEILILDEPTAGLDVELRKELWKYIVNINTQGKTIFLTTHYIEEAQELAERVCIIHKGKIIELSNKKDLMKKWGAKEIKISIKKPTVAIEEKFMQYVENEGDTWTFIIKNKFEEAQSLLAYLHTKNIPIIDIATKEESLEAIFLKLTHNG